MVGVIQPQPAISYMQNQAGRGHPQRTMH